MSIKDGGPAFPAKNYVIPADLEKRHVRELGTSRGMTLRDYFAARFAQAELMTCGVPGKACDALMSAINRTGERPEDHMARCAYDMADAMLRAREVTHD